MLDRFLGQVPGYVSAGEVVHLWTRGLQRNESCGCGEPFRSCPFWVEVGRQAFGGWDSIDVDAMIDLQRRVDRTRYIPLMVVPALSPGYRRSLAAYRSVLARLFAAIGGVGGGVVIDSSKHASTAFLLRGMRELDLGIVHLVRDSRGVTYSLMKQVRRPEGSGAASYMYRSGPVRSGIDWLTINALFHVVGRRATPVLRARYEDLARDPAGVLGELIERDGQTRAGMVDRLSFLDGNRAMLGVDHTVAGNPIRFSRREFTVRQDDEWRQALPAWARRVTTLVTWPLLLAYRYTVVPR